MTTNLMAAHRQWANRPNDERFNSIEEMALAAKNKRNSSSEQTLHINRMKAYQTSDDGIAFSLGNRQDIVVNNYAFKQLCGHLDYPTNGLVDKIPANLVTEILNHRLDVISKSNPEKEIQVLMDTGKDVTIRSITSDRYGRFWDDEAIKYLKMFENRGYKVPPARPSSEDQPGSRIATEADCVKGSRVKPGDTIAPAGLYMGDRDMFAIMINPDDATDDGGGNGLVRGMFITNSEVGARSFSITEFTLQEVCGNHIVWGATDIVQVRYRHIGDCANRINASMRQWRGDVKRNWTPYLNTISAMRRSLIANNRDDVIDGLYGLRIDNNLTKSVITDAYDNADEFRDQDGDPRTWYGMTNAITRRSQLQSNADKRFDIDTAVGKLYEFAASNLVSVK